MKSIWQMVARAVLLATPLPLLAESIAEPPLPPVATVLTRAVDWHLEGREVILRRAIHYHEGKTGVRKAW